MSYRQLSLSVGGWWLVEGGGWLFKFVVRSSWSHALRWRPGGGRAGNLPPLWNDVAPWVVLWV